MKNRAFSHPRSVSMLSLTGRQLSYGTVDDLVRREARPANCHTLDKPGSWCSLDLGVWMLPNAYTLRHAKGYSKSALRNWNFELSKDGTEWVTIREHRNDASLQDAGSTHTWTLSLPPPPPGEAPPVANDGFRYVRIKMTGTNESGE